MVNKYAVWIIIAGLVCNQQLYDAIYLRLTRDRLSLNIDKLQTINREGVIFDYTYIQVEPNLFDIFRKLCNGQRSTYEREHLGN